ncbi:hypothetical protein GUJ93_ZPchr0007g5771 [Zizania palustris]|uniref:NAC domain-containing protein n=1 Tax=Zizania palustris TaxID=103762 RepID=A0A8J5SV98_ZIZPA|nr:hypothetical protein GUJ93_ZPchr0007g5771 [Zizania palustris]
MDGGFPPGVKFDPVDGELVAGFLLPRIQGKKHSLDGVIVEADPLTAPPWALLKDHDRKGDEAFFFASAQAKNGKGSRQKRTVVGGGCWKGQRMCVDGERLRVPIAGGGGLEIGWRKYVLNFHADGERGSSGWVMHEYAITAPADLAASPTRLYRIRFSGYGKKRKREPDCPGGHNDDGRARAARPRAVVETALHLPLPHPVSLPGLVDVPTAVVDIVDGSVIADKSSSAPTEDDFLLLNLELPDVDEILRSFPDFTVDPFFFPGEQGSGAESDEAIPEQSRFCFAQVTEFSESASPGVQEAVHSVVHGSLATLSPKIHSKDPPPLGNASGAALNLGDTTNITVLVGFIVAALLLLSYCLYQCKDSPRPLLLSKSMDGTYVIGIDRSNKVPVNPVESSRRFPEQSRFSCDDRQLLRPVEAQDDKKPSTRLKELPRLSLDSRKESLSPSSRQKNSGYKRTDSSLMDTLRPQDSPRHRRATSVIAKLMLTTQKGREGVQYPVYIAAKRRVFSNEDQALSKNSY